MEHTTQERMFEIQRAAIDAGKTTVILPTLSSFQTAISNFSRAGITEVWVSAEALQAADYSLLNVCHLGDVNTRIERYSTAQSVWDESGVELIVIEDTSVAVLDVKTNQEYWDTFGALDIDAKRIVLGEYGAQFLRNSNRGSKGYDDVKKAWLKIAS